MKLIDILCPYKAFVDRLSLVVQHLHAHVKGSVGECRLCARFYFSRNVQNILSILFGKL